MEERGKGGRREWKNRMQSWKAMGGNKLQKDCELGGAAAYG